MSSSTNTNVMSSSSSSGGFLLFIVFLVLKLTGVIDWSWWFVTMPLWIGLALTLGFLLVGAVGALVVGTIAESIGAISRKRDRAKRKQAMARKN